MFLALPVVPSSVAQPSWDHSPTGPASPTPALWVLPKGIQQEIASGRIQELEALHEALSPLLKFPQLWGERKSNQRIFLETKAGLVKATKLTYKIAS